MSFIQLSEQCSESGLKLQSFNNLNYNLSLMRMGDAMLEKILVKLSSCILHGLVKIVAVSVRAAFMEDF